MSGDLGYQQRPPELHHSLALDKNSLRKASLIARVSIGDDLLGLELYFLFPEQDDRRMGKVQVLCTFLILLLRVF